MTILVAYVPRPEGRAALDKGIEMARHFDEALMVVNASPGGPKSDASMADTLDVVEVEKLLKASGLKAEFKQFVRGKDAFEEIEALVESLKVSMLVIGLRKRSPVGKLFLGSVAQEILLSVPCPVLAVKAK
ncbi:universal stress protein [mine drainage metagenome]|uniref:Universal stress protein n=1 Tax=mine drainage metagenome TaxID=410659 RepID=A0A1J5PXN9_9ZZZZ